MKTLLMITLLTLTSFNISARNPNPRHKLTITMNNYILQQKIGQEVERAVNKFYPFFNYVIGCPTGNINQYPCPHDKAFKRLENLLVIHPDLHSASNEYLSWIMVQGMASMVMHKRYQLDKYPRVRVVEVEQLIMLTAQRFWNELNPPMSRGLDLYRTSRDNIAFNLDLSVLAFTRAYNQSPKVNFFNKVALRATRYEGIYLSVSDIIDNDQFTEKEKEVARDILVDFENAL
ncbi:hypothetical protein BIY24_09885 [Halobacteriovorax marinus]|uniref:hypothetical protein n=1 Tax=Halobacteriovorax marinus TaxID=97084 RepID=UPI000BC35471|nr:hypothetical protein [Halobacteriovorax marinus]ATH08249.1 hypothetical protein BIY24_09885 [Halobacteriovorax marinus]